ncbi:CoA pyrophosphatase [Desulfovibrio sp. OttesenSCG-928-C06]|nr:CoA pyrophosphatase [Desulfovibrio sp. OttesenSCG-928-C06]
MKAEKISGLLSGCLPGRQAQAEMCPALMRPLLKEEIPAKAVDSAVNLILRPQNGGSSFDELLDWQILLIRRNTYRGVHSGQIALPGGKCEPGESYWQTACRETFEEVGIACERLEIQGALSSIYVQPSNFVIHPFVVVCRDFGELSINPREVVDYKLVPVLEFDPARASDRDFTYPDGSVRQSPAWVYQDYVVWGATAMILAEFYRVLSSRP